MDTMLLYVLKFSRFLLFVLFHFRTVAHTRFLLPHLALLDLISELTVPLRPTPSQLVSTFT